MRDVLNLIPLARSLGNVDMNNVFMVGESRGGMMTYLALKHNIPVNAAAVKSGGTDFIGNLKDRPEFGKAYQQLIPDYEKRLDEALRKHSAIALAGENQCPPARSTRRPGRRPNPSHRSVSLLRLHILALSWRGLRVTIFWRLHAGTCDIYCFPIFHMSAIRRASQRAASCRKKDQHSPSVQTLR